MPRTLPASRSRKLSLTGPSNIVRVLSNAASLLAPTMPAEKATYVETTPNTSSMPPKGLDHPSKGQHEMTDAMFASELMQETFPVRSGRNVKAAIGEAFDALKRRERQLPQSVLRDRPRQWTERRVRALWNREARRVDHYEIQDLTAVAVEEARLERRRLQARQDRLAALIAAADAGTDQSVGELESGLAGGLDLPGTSGTDADHDADQSHWGR